MDDKAVAPAPAGGGLKRNLILILGVLGASTSCLFVRWATAPPMLLAGYRMLLTALVMTPYMLAVCRDELKRVSRRQLLLCLAAGTSLGVHFTCYFSSLNHTSIAAAQTLASGEVFCVALASWLLWRERINRAGIAAVLLIFGGGLLIGFSDAGAGAASPTALLGDLLGLGAGLTMGAYTLIGRRLRRELSTGDYTYLVYCAAAVTLAVMLLLGGQPLAGFGGINWLCALGMTVFCTLGGHTVYSWALKYFPAAHVSAVKLLDPLFSTGWGLLLWLEVPSLLTVVGCLVIIGGTFIYIKTGN